MFKSILAAVLTVAALTLTGCGTAEATTPATYADDTSAPVAPITASSSPANLPLVGDADELANELYLTPQGQVQILAVRSHLSPTANLSGSDHDLLKLGVTTCQALDRGVTFVQLGGIGLSSGFSPSDTGSILGGSIGALCNRHLSDMHS